MNRTNQGATAPPSPDATLGNPLPHQIAEWIAKRIFTGELAAGDRLKEEELAALFHTSRAPVREALYLLQLDNLVERQPRRGTVVRAFSEDDIRDLYEVRSTLEQSAIDRLSRRWSDDCGAAFDSILSDMQRAVLATDSPGYSLQNSRFHDTLFQYAGSAILHGLYHQLGHPLQYLLETSTRTPAQMHASYAEHRAIVACLQAGEFTAAKQLLAENVGHGLTRVIDQRRRQQDSAGAANHE